MSEENQADTSSFCASCGIAEIDDIKLKDCDDCDLVRYCSDACKELHRPEHAGKCRKRAAELRDELLFKQPESTHEGDCPICMVPLPLDKQTSSIMSCCSKVVCNGCDYANIMRERKERRPPKCPFCRELLPNTNEECDKRRMKRAEMNDPVAMCQLGVQKGLEGDYGSALEYLTKASLQGDAEAHFLLSDLYRRGEGVEKDKGKEVLHAEEAAIGGHPDARYALGGHEYNNGNIERAVKHWIIAAAQGHDRSIKTLMEKFREGYVSNGELAAAFRAHKAAVDATKSPQREKGEEYCRNMDNN